MKSTLSSFAGAALSAAFLLLTLSGCSPSDGAQALAAGSPDEAKKAETKQVEEKKYPEQDTKLGALTGKVTLKGAGPKLEPIPVDQANRDAKVCGKSIANKTLVVSGAGEVADVIVAIMGYKPASRPEKRTISLDNKGCSFVPYVNATTRGSTLMLLNSDPVLHNTHVLLVNPFNVAVPSGRPVKKPLRRAGWMPVKCDIHPWMEANILVFDHALFDKSNAKGEFKIPNIPPGEYEVGVWHKKLAFAFDLKKMKTVGKIKVEAGQTAKLDFTLDAPKQ